MKFTHRRQIKALCAAAAATLGINAGAHAQVATLSKGDQLLVNNGLQVWGLVTDANYQFNYANMAAANFNAVTWSFGASSTQLLSAGQKWGKWVDHMGHPSTALTATEQAHFNDLLTLQVGDEQQGDLESPNGFTRQWFQAAHAGNYFPNQLLTVNSFFINSDAAYADFIAAANPDAIAWDGYPFTIPPGVLITPTNWLVNANRFRRHALGSYIGATGNSPRPYGMYLQTYHASDGARDPSDVEMRWQQFVAWTMGYKFVNTFTAGGGNTSLFVSGNQNLPNEPYYSSFKETARQGQNLGPALTRLISHGYGPSIVLGKDANGATNPMVGEWLVFNQNNAPPAQPFLTSLSAVNTGTKNGGHPGDIYVGFHNPLHTSYGPAGEVYFMVMNGLGGNASDPVGTVAEYQQQITMNFDTQYSGVSTLQRMRRSDGQVEIVPLTRTTARLYNGVISLEGGTGDLFKYNDGTPFVGWNNILYWDNDASAANNNTSTGGGMGGAGSWDAAANKWYNGSANGAWAGNRDAIFWGTAGTITLSVPQSINSLSFKSNGYTISGSTLTMAGQTISADNGVTATISSTVSGTGGIIKSGPGTLVLSNAANTITGGATVLGGTLQISADGALGPAPSTFTAGNIILNGGTLRFGASFDISNNRGISLGPAGGTIDTQGFSNVSGYTQPNGIAGVGDLIKTGAGTFFMNTGDAVLNTGWKSNLVMKQGIWKVNGRGGLPYNANADSIYRPGHLTFDGGTLQIAASFAAVSSNYRGITIAAGGGAIDTQSFNFAWGGPVIGNVPAATWTKLGTGTLTLNSALTTGTPSSYSGNFNINAGTVVLAGGIAMGDLAALNNSATLTLFASETIGSLSGSGVTNLAGTLTTGGNNNSTTYSGVITGAGGINKVGSGTMSLTGSNNYTGATAVSGGTLVFGQSHTKSASLTVAGATARVASGGDKVLKTGSIVITGTGKLDLTDNDAIVTGMSYSAVESLVKAGFGNSNWLGTGITSSTAATTSARMLGIVDNASTNYTTFSGQTVSNTNILVKYTYLGDANLDGLVTPDDFTLFVTGSSGGQARWGFGDFDYNGFVNPDDFTLFVNGLASFNANGGQQLSEEFKSQLAGFASGSGVPLILDPARVPEPSSLAAVCIAAATFLARRRKSK